MAVMVSGGSGGSEMWVDITSSLSVQTQTNKLVNGITGSTISSIKAVSVDPTVYGRKFRVKTRVSSDGNRPAPMTYYAGGDPYFMPLSSMFGSRVGSEVYTCYMEYVVVVPPNATEVYFPVINTSEGIIVERAV